MLLSILIPTLEKRQHLFNPLVEYIRRVIELEGLDDLVEIVSYCDDGKLSIGEKRTRLYQMAKGVYGWQIDDDDDISNKALPSICTAAGAGPDCITFQERCIIDGIEKRSNFSLKYADWGENQDGFDYVRTPFFKTPIKTSICLQAPIPFISFGEDHAFARNVKPFLHSEIHIPEFFYYYTKNNQYETKSL